MQTSAHQDSDSDPVAETRIILVGARPVLGRTHAGGQLTASLGLAEYARENGIELDVIDTAQSNFPPPPLWRRVARAAGRVAALLGRLRRRRAIDGVLIFASGGASFYERVLLAGLCRLYRVKCLLFVRSGHFMTACEDSPRRQRLYGRMLRIPDMLGAQGSNWRALYRSLGVDDARIVTVRNWLAPGRTVATHGKRVQGEVTFLYVGWLVEKKGINELLEAVAESDRLRRCRVLIAGGGTLYEPLRAAVADRSLHHVSVLGWQTPEQIDELLEQAQVFVLPSHAEGFPNALLEAMSRGLAAIVTPVGAVPDSARDGYNSLWAIPGDATSLRAAMEALADDPRRVEQFSRHSLELARTLHDRDRNCAALFQALLG